MRVLLFVALFAVVATAVITPTAEESQFTQWMAKHGKSFGDDLFKRYEIFKVNLAMINKHNAGNHSYTMAMNEFGAHSWEEFRVMAGFGGAAQKAWATESTSFEDVADVAAEIDWTTKGAVTAVKNQGQCGSCWSFSTTGSVEGALAIKTGNLIALSEQELVDCDWLWDHGCNGGLMDNAFSFIKKHKGLCSEEAYPYKAVKGSCNKKCDVVPGTAVKSWVDVAHDEKSMMAALNVGPVSIAIEADQRAFQFYSGGVFNGDCGTNLDHGVLAVGYGEENGKKFWKVKNSWGASWGDHGFIRLARGKAQEGGQCGILLSASYPRL